MDNKMEAKVLQNSYSNNLYYVYVNEYSFDGEIARLLNLNVNKYQNYLQNNFNGHMSVSNEIYFRNKQDALNATEWINSILMLILLGGHVDD